VHLDACDKAAYPQLIAPDPDGRHEFTRVVENSEEVALEMVFSGTHQGPLYGPAGEVPATGRKVTLKIADFYRVSGDRIVSYHGYSDQAAMAAQLAPPPEA
jgi:predicted ester cyclase